MISVYYGNRCSGKTVKLLKEAAKSAIDGNEALIITYNEASVQVYKERLEEMFGPVIAKQITVKSYSSVKDYLVGRDRKNLKAFIDDSAVILYRMLFGMSNTDVSMTIDTTEGIELKRSDWDKE